MSPVLSTSSSTNVFDDLFQELTVTIENIVEDFDGDDVEDSEDTDQYKILSLSDWQVEFLTGQTSSGGEYFARRVNQDYGSLLQLVEVSFSNGKYSMSSSIYDIDANSSHFLDKFGSFAIDYKDNSKLNYSFANPEDTASIFKTLPDGAIVGDLYSDFSGNDFGQKLDYNISQNEFDYGTGLYALFADPDHSNSYKLEPVVGLEINGVRSYALFNDPTPVNSMSSYKLPIYNPRDLATDSKIGFFKGYNIDFLTESPDGQDGAYALFEDGLNGFVLTELLQVRTSEESYFLELNASNRLQLDEQNYAVKLYDLLSENNKTYDQWEAGITIIGTIFLSELS